ncbi:unnamed protein product [Orchesella dallaii]|uniref:Uncharacterized protein n=1 Tax=Orchesella dallaii TaxID=48710 RepID=A0ABP1PS05_9HEXA
MNWWALLDASMGYVNIVDDFIELKVVVKADNPNDVTTGNESMEARRKGTKQVATLSTEHLCFAALFAWTCLVMKCISVAMGIQFVTTVSAVSHIVHSAELDLKIPGFETERWRLCWISLKLNAVIEIEDAM